MKHYSLILHGAITPGPEAREALKTALSAILHFDSDHLNRVFSQLPSALKEQLTLEEAQKLQFTVESLDGDVELIESTPAAIPELPSTPPPPSSATPVTHKDSNQSFHHDFDLTLAPADEELHQSENEPGEETAWSAPTKPSGNSIVEEEAEFSLELGEPGSVSSQATKNKVPPARPSPSNSPTAPQPDTATISFEFDEPSAPATPTSPVNRSVEAPPPAIDLHFDSEPEDAPQSQPTPSLPPSQPSPQGGTEMEGDEIGFEDEITQPPIVQIPDELLDEPAPTTPPPRPASPTQRVSRNVRKPTEPLDWQTLSVNWNVAAPESQVPPPAPSSRSSPSLLGILALLALGGGAVFFLTPDEPKKEVSLPVDQLLKDQSKILRRKKGADSNGDSQTPALFTKFWRVESRVGKNMLTLEIGQSKLGLGIHEVTIVGDPPTQLTKQDYMRGVRPEPWLRRFESRQRVLAPEQVSQPSGDPHTFSASVTSKIFVEHEEEPSNFPGTFTVRGKVNPETDTISGDWRLSNLELPDEFSDTILIRKVDSGYEVIFKGGFEATAVAPTPTPAPRVESSPPPVAEELSEESTEPTKPPKGKKKAQDLLEEE